MARILAKCEWCKRVFYFDTDDRPSQYPQFYIVQCANRFCERPVRVTTKPMK